MAGSSTNLFSGPDRASRCNSAISGLVQKVPIRDGFSIALCDVKYRKPVDCERTAGEYLKFHFKLAGASAIHDGHGDFIPVEPGRISMLVQPTDWVKLERMGINTHERAITMICSRDFASNMLPTTGNLPAFIKNFLCARAPRFSFSSVPLPLPMRAIVEDLLNPPFENRLRAMIFEAKALELLCFTIHQISDAPVTGVIRTRDRAKVVELRALLETHPESNLSIRELSKMLAWNETQMMDCFKQVTGTTISNYRHGIRMDNARRQLRDTDASVTEVAFNSGYEHPCNFATAFKRTFGYSPKLARHQR